MSKRKKQTQTAVVYCGPTIPGVVKQFAVYRDGEIPKPVEKIVKEHAGAGSLLVGLDQFPDLRRNLENPESVEAILCDTITNQ